jgi:Alanine-zipper, major outer membrane lipoprotein
MSNLARSFRIGTMIVGMAVMMSACAQLGESDKAALDQARTDATNAQAAADRATQAAERAEKAATDAADAASNAQMAMERQDRMMQQSLRK